MFLSLSTSTWVLIAAGATLVNLAAMQWIIQIPKYRKRQFWLPVIGMVCVGARGFAESAALADTLYLYAAIMVVFPAALAPVRRQITRDYYRWVEDPTTRASKAALAWCTTSLTVMLFVIGVVWVVGKKAGT
ncbi:hypothetical protein [Streptomyces lydicus]|uniref:Uncharacterized protein n=1 Tax=Streptomyces lydicus TaxID=47763 RepID=A0A1D7VLR2_9ACTN|nr:hypothetical protein [Streptomyces lydicus]AOP47693.1 hypothetical protein SL103_16830 [Streptomyces lydicus]